MNRIKPVAPALMLLAASFLAALLTSTALAQHEDNSVCPLSDEQTQKSVQSFDKVANVFTQQPRCVNCHGAVDPFGPDAEDKHGGGKLDPIMKTEPGNNTGEPVTVQDDEATFGQCRTCHDAFSRDWHIPPAALSFVGKDAITLCKGQKDFFNFDGAAFIKHIEQDADPNNPFIQEAFTGRMGLNDVGQSLTNKYPEPPQGLTRQDLIQMAHDWVDANGGKFKGGLDCGCVPHHYAIGLEETGMIDFASSGLTVHAVRTGKGDIPLSFKDDASFVSEVRLPTMWNITSSAVGGTCSSQTSQPNQMKVTGNVDDDGKMHLKFGWSAPGGTYRGICTGGAVTLPFSGSFPSVKSDGVKSPFSDGFEIPAIVGETQTFTFSAAGGKFTCTITLKQID